MSLEFVGAIGTQNASEYRPTAGGPVVDKTFVSAFARAHEYAGFDRVLIGYFSSAPDGFQVAAYAGQQTERLKFLLAHRPGFVAPTVAARQVGLAVAIAGPGRYSLDAWLASRATRRLA